MLFSFDSCIYRAIRSATAYYAPFESFYFDVAMFIAYIVCFVVKLTFNFLYSSFVILYVASSHFSVTYQFYGFIHDLLLYFKYASRYQYLARSSRIICEHYSIVSSIPSD